MKVTPYNTGKLLIGSNWQPQPKPPRMSRTETMLQASLLEAKPRKQAKLAKPVAARQTDWDGIVIVGGVIASVVIVYAWLWSSI
jgi:hypothetical protein